MGMDNRLLLTLSLEEAGEGHGMEEGELDAFMAGLVADLNDIEAVNAALASAEETEPGSKALGTFLLGVLTAEVTDGTDVAVEMEGSAKDKEAMEALLTRMEACVQKVS